jgi:membrane protein implicated in regulation of membrane protease activity
MGLLILVLLFLAAALGVLGAVLKVAFILVASLVFAMIVLAYLAAWYVRRRVQGFQRDVDRRMDDARRRREAYDVTSDDASRRALGDGS